MNTTTQSESVIKLIWHKSTSINQYFDKSLGSIHGIGLTEYMVLDTLKDAPSQQMRRVDLAEALGRTASGITRLLMPMEKIGLVEKVASERDARVSLVKISKAGLKIFNQANRSFQQSCEALLAEISDKDKHRITASIDKIMPK